MKNEIDLEVALEVYKSTTIKAMLEAATGTATTQKKNNIARLVPILRDEQRIRRNLAGLNEVEKLALGLIHEQGDEIASDHLCSLLTHEGVLKSTPVATKIFVGFRQVDWYEGNPHYKGQPAYEDLMAGLVLKGLAFSREPQRQDRGVIEWTPGRVIFIPAFIARHLPAVQLRPAGLPDKGEPPFVLPGSARNFQRDLSHYARFLRRQKELSLTSQGLVYKKTLKEIAAGLGFTVDLGSGKGELENGRLFFLRRLLLPLGLAEAEWNQLLPNALDEHFWQLGPTQRVQKTFETWRDGVVWNELRQLSYYERGSDKTADAPPALSASRRAILQHVKSLGPGWIRLPDLVAYIRRKDYGFLFAKRKYDTYRGWGPYNDSTPYSLSNSPLGMGFRGITSEVDGWNKVEAGFINHVIVGPLFWMGLVDLGYKSEPAVDLSGTAPALAYRLTDMGAWLLGLRGQVEISHQQSGGLVVQPNFEVLVMEPIADEVLLALDQFAESKGGDRVITYELTRASVYRGQRHEWPVGRIIPYLESSAKQPLPANVRRTLEEWEALHQRITIRRRINLAQTADPQILQELLQNPLGAKLRPVTDTIGLSEAPLSELANGLRQVGWLPAQTPAGQTDAPQSVVIDEDGRVRFAHRVPSLYALGAIASLSVEASPEHEQGAQRRITPAMIKAALKQGRTLPDLIAHLQRLNQGVMPEKFILKMKAWTEYYGHAQEETVILLEFRDKAARDELVADPALRGLLSPFRSADRALAAAHPDHLAEVHALLAERGIPIQSGLKP